MFVWLLCSSLSRALNFHFSNFLCCTLGILTVLALSSLNDTILWFESKLDFQSLIIIHNAFKFKVHLMIGDNFVSGLELTGWTFLTAYWTSHSASGAKMHKFMLWNQLVPTWDYLV